MLNKNGTGFKMHCSQLFITGVKQSTLKQSYLIFKEKIYNKP